MALIAGAALIALGLHPAEADVTAVKGSALGYFADNISLFAGPQPDTGPTPTVTLAADASNSPQNSAPSGIVTYGPAILFTSDTITVSSSGTLGATGAVTSTSSIDNINKSTSQPNETGGEILTADNLSGTATASEGAGASGSTTVTNGKVATHSNSFNCSSPTTPCGGHTHDAANPEGLVSVPANPAPNTKIAGHVHLTDTTTDFFVIVFNEQITNPDGSITVNPVHEYFGATLDAGNNVVDHPGSILQGDLSLGQVVAGVTASGSGGSTATTAPGDTTTTEAGGTTTTLEPGATTTEPGAATTTTAAGGTGAAPAGTASSPAGGGPRTITEVAGGAYGFSTKISLFGGPSTTIGPTPSVTLPKNGANPALTASAPSGIAQYGPATIFGGQFVDPGRNPSGPLTVSTEGKTGPGGFVTSTASVANVGPGPVIADRFSSTCRASEEGVTGSTTVTKGIAETSYDKATQEPKTKVDVPANPPPNMTVEGTLDHIGDRYRIVFNEIQRTPGAITVNAVHMYLLGPIAVGDMIVGQVRCATTAAFAASGGASGAGGTTVSGAARNGVAATGFETRAWLALALLLLAVGSWAVLWSRRRPASAGAGPPNAHGR